MQASQRGPEEEGDGGPQRTAGSERAANPLDEAIACYRKAIEADPANAIAFINLGISLRDLLQLDGQPQP